MFKKFAVLCVVLCLGLCMAGCGGSKKAEMPSDKAAPVSEQPAAAAAESMEAPK